MAGHKRTTTKLHKDELDWLNLEHHQFTVLKKVSEHERKVHRNGNPNSCRTEDILKVKCKRCGSIKNLRANTLYNGNTRCSHCPNERHYKRIGNIIGGLKIVDVSIQLSGKKNRTFWIFECLKCGVSFRKVLGGEHQLTNQEFKCSNCRKQSCAKYNKAFFKKTPKGIWRSLKYGAMSRGKSFEITIDHLIERLNHQNGLCSLTGLKIEIENGTASVDRIDNLIGYVPENIQWVYKPINFMKGGLTQDEFIELCKSVARKANEDMV
jgi:hypothetical protein